MNGYLDNLKQFLTRLSIGQQVALSMVVLGGIGLLIAIAYWAGKPDYTLLFGKLESTEASQIVESLQSKGIKYDLRDNGTAIYVPREDVYELRLSLAGEGLVSKGPAGYELFDQGTLGMTDFMQKLNMKRALEGELARTISSIGEVELCRVHLVIPERSPFREAQTHPTASVVLQMRNGNGLAGAQIEGITSLVSGAVEGLATSNVTVLDTHGNLLSNPDAGDETVAAGNSYLKMQRSVEGYLTEQGQSMLDRMLGPGNAILRVNARLDNSRTVSESELIDPESATIVSEEQLEETGDGANATSAVRNFEMSRTRERSEKNSGDISYLTVSVILNYKQVPDPDPEDEAVPEPVPYSPEEIQNIESLVRNAVGFNEQRGDQVAIHQTRFDTSVDQTIAEDVRAQQRTEQLQLLLRYGLMLLALGVAVWLIRSASRNMQTAKTPVAAVAHRRGSSVLGGANRALPASSGDGSGPLPLTPNGESDGDEEDELVDVNDVFASKLSPEARKRLKAKHIIFEEIKQQALANPQAVVELVRTWMNEDQKQGRSN